jgi:energy-coupling factor transporter ATP-binding protein EcfA2
VKILGLQVKNFKGFKDSGFVEFSPHFTVIVGQNNSGKTAIIEALKLSGAENSPYREKGKAEDYELDPYSLIKSSQYLTKQDIVRAALKNDATIYVPSSTDAAPFLNALNGFKKGRYEMEVYLGSGSYSILESPIEAMPIANGMYVKVHYDRSSGIFAPESTINTSGGPEHALYKKIESQSIFVLNSQRFNIGRHSMNVSKELAQDASNLPAALNDMQGNQPQIFRELRDNLKEIFPSIGDVTVRPIPGNSEVEILIWPYEGNNSNEATPLNKCGTGISQAIAILFAAMYPDERVIVIDEISSFLHPMAVKNLISILKENYSRHQYIISTHYTDVISWCEPESIVFTKKVDNECKAQNIRLKQIEEFKFLADELGISMTDVFGSNRIIWVEGKTEAACFPYLLQHLKKKLPKGTNFSVLTTGDVSLSNRTAATAFEIYDKISKMASPLTQSCIFTLDRESMSDSQIADLKKKSHNDLLVLDRRCYENYLISPSAIFAVIGEHLNNGVDVNAIAKWLVENAGDQKYKAYNEWKGSLEDEAWLRKVDGAKLLHDAFNALTDARCEYIKTKHSLLLTKTLCEARDPCVKELLSFVEEIYGLVTKGAVH